MKHLLTYALLLGATGPLLSQTPPESPPLFLIETITVEGADVFSPDILVSTSLLEEGGTYSERELRDAIFRIVRLPLILDAEFALRKGSERGRFELVITVWDARRWFFGYDMALTRWRRPVSLDSPFGDDRSARLETLVGRRFAIGRHGVFFFAVGPLNASLEAGYTQYNLFGRDVLLNLSYSVSLCNEDVTTPGQVADSSCNANIVDLGLDPTFASWTSGGDNQRATLTLGIPIRGNQSLRLFASRRTTDSGTRQPALTRDFRRFSDFDDRENLEVSLSWIFNSLDDTVFPTAGSFLDGGAVFRSQSADLEVIDFHFPIPFPFEPVLAVHSEADELRLRALAERYWPVSRPGTVWARARASLGRSQVRDLPLPDLSLIDDDLDLWSVGATFGYGHFLKRTYGRPRWREVRWESEVEAFFESTSPDFGLESNPLDGFRIGTGITFRNTWGVFRLEVNYLDVGRL